MLEIILIIIITTTIITTIITINNYNNNKIKVLSASKSLSFKKVIELKEL